MADLMPMYIWDIPDGACGATRHLAQAIGDVREELAGAEPGTVVPVVKAYLSPDGRSEYVRVKVMGQAERTPDGVVWLLGESPATASS